MASNKENCREDCFLCFSKFQGRQHAHPRKWSDDLLRFLSEVAVVGERCDECVCKACEVNVRQCMKKKEKGDPSKL